jgi:hypothetical protein
MECCARPAAKRGKYADLELPPENGDRCPSRKKHPVLAELTARARSGHPRGRDTLPTFISREPVVQGKSAARPLMFSIASPTDVGKNAAEPIFLSPAIG